MSKFKRVEVESFLKSFFLFFSSLSLLVGMLVFMDFNEKVKSLDERILDRMRVCSYTLECSGYEIDFTQKKDQSIYKLYKTSQGVESYFPIPSSKSNLLVIRMDAKTYEEKKAQIKRKSIMLFLILEMVVLTLSVLFSFYALRPLRDALHLTEEFIKDILHDFNTPIATLMLNISMMGKKYGRAKQFERIENALATIVMLQNNLKSYLDETLHKEEVFPLREMILQRVEAIKKSYPDIGITVEVDSGVVLQCDKDSFIRIVDNLLSNALKYNMQNGYVKIFYKSKTLYIKDSGIGIKNPKRVFERFYKENQRGIGIGLHIVKKLCDSLGIEIELESEVGKGTLFKLHLDKITKN